MEKRSLRKLFLLMSAGFVLAACGTETEETPQETANTEETTEVSNNSETATDEITATLNIVIDGEQMADLSQEVTVPEGSYLLDVMHDVYDVEDEATFVTSIEGYEQDLDAERYWLSYKDGEMLPVGAADYELEEADEIEWRLEDSE